MLRAVRSSLPSFKPVLFTEGLNVILATRTKVSKEKDTVNGLGKSTLLDIVHYCLGSDPAPGRGIFVPELKDVVFELEFDIQGKVFSARRSTTRGSRVTLRGDTSNWPIQPRENTKTGEREFPLEDWCDALGSQIFGVPVFESDLKFKPTFRSLISYVMRRYDAYSSPFQQNTRQQPWDIQVNTAYLLGLTWEDASRLQQVREKERQLRVLRGASKSGVLEGVLGSRGELEARRLHLQDSIDTRAKELRDFRVLPEYREFERRADELTDGIHEALNRATELKQLRRYYEASLVSEKEPDADRVAQLYNEAQVEIPEVALRRLEQVKEFHSKVVTNRRAFLENEIVSLRSRITETELLLARLTEDRSKLLKLLHEHHALDEFTALQTSYQSDVAELESITARIRSLTEVERGLSATRMDRESLVQQALLNYASTEVARARAIQLFNKNSHSLYDAPGDLVIDITQNGFEFNVRIEGAGSTGREHMNIFCYDLMIAQLWAERSVSPHFLFHDSTIFEGVDHRQVAAGLELAASESSRLGFQYVTAMNADAVPFSDFSKDFEFQNYVRLELTDDHPEGGLLGFRIKGEQAPEVAETREEE
jgi:uncharacterized protein YydD (DUF2326 family)